ncbi:MAG: substrate-binding domain-containing protein [Firmicutes bacterium]|nr:substrate-binding domain-containing protein [Bacillota bacterium]
MEFILKRDALPKKSRLTIGFLDENLYNEFYSQMMPGVFEAARKCEANIIRFAYYSYHFAYNYKCQRKMILDLISQFDLDGLLFLGWARAGPLENYEEFTTRFKAVPLLSLGTGFSGIPCVFSPGSVYIQEIIIHLVEFHHYRRIAYIAPAAPDDRNQTYLSLMKEYGIFHPELFVSEQDLEGIPFPGRAKRALEILLDERHARFDAIMTTYSEDARNLLQELAQRGFKVPQDIALTSFEERDIIKYSSPGLTTIYFPWIELGATGCMKLVELLSEGHIPLMTEVPGKVIYRNSCGCMSNSIQLAGRYQVEARAHTIADMTESEQIKIVAGMERAFPDPGFDFHALLQAFLTDFNAGTNQSFLAELASQLRRANDCSITHSHIHFSLKDLISVFRGLLLPYLMNDPNDLLWSGDLFQQAEVMVWEKITNIYNSTKVKNELLNQALQEISQILITSFNMENLMDSLARNLPKLQIPGCYIFLFQPALNDGEGGKDLFDRCVPAFYYSNYTRVTPLPDKPASLSQLLTGILGASGRPYGLLAHLLHVTDEFMGFVLFEPGPMDQMLYQTLTTHISTALRGVQLLEKLEASYQELTRQAYREGMADISIEILHNIGNILNSINVSADLIKTATDSPLIPYLINANQLLESHLEDLENFISSDTKGMKLMQFYLKLGAYFAEFKNQVLYNSNRLDDKVKSIVDLISAQQTYTGVNESIERHDIASILDDIIKLMAGSIEKYQIQINKDYQARPKVMVQRMKLFHILFKLIDHAKSAMAQIHVDERKLTLTICEDERGKYIRITNSGRGISNNMLEKIFDFGYPTQTAGYELGLQSCLKYMNEMGGKIWVETNAPNYGATFVLQFN